MSLLRAVLIAALLFPIAHPTGAETPVSPLPVVDFRQWFPWLVWVSTEGHDAEYPDGFRYKVLSERDADSKLVDFVLMRQLHDGSKIIAIHARVSLMRDASCRTYANDRAGFGTERQEFSVIGAPCA